MSSPHTTLPVLLTSPLLPPAYVGNADMIQPDLTPLQPSLDDFMEISGGTGPSHWGRAETSGWSQAPWGEQRLWVISEGNFLVFL